MIGFVLMKPVANKPFCTYSALYVSVSGGFSVPSMVVNSIISQTSNAMGFYTGYFDHVTKHACTLHESTWVCFEWWSTKHFWWSTEHFTTWLCLHFIPTSRYFIFSQSDFTKRVLSTWLSGRFSFLLEESPLVNQRLQTGNIRQW